MSRTLKIELKPIGPYFFGNDRIFHYGKDDISRIGGSKYFIRSEKIPLQTSLFGVLRYLGILDKKMQIAPLSEEDKKNIGKESFEYEKEQQVFGEIEKLSPLYLKRKDDLYIRLPRDHKNKQKETKDKEQIYSPFKEYRLIRTSKEDRLLPLDYSAKDDLADGFLNIRTGEVLSYEDVFCNVEKTGICVEKNESAYYKMEYVSLNSDYSWVFYATVGNAFPELKDQLVYMGARKSLFLATISDEEEPEYDLSGGPKGYEKLYFISDAYIDKEKTEELRKISSFMNVETRTARSYVTDYAASDQKSRFRKREKLYRLIRAGSILLYPEEKREEVQKLVESSHMNYIGCNRYKIGGAK